jgi:hypothetical protein
MQDAAFMVTVAHFMPTVPQLAKNPVFLFLSDNFQKPNPFKADVVVAIDKVFEQKANAIWQLESQIESLWATGNFERVVPVPTDPAGREERRLALQERQAQRDKAIANKYRSQLVSYYGEEEAKKVQYAEAFELCEYGRQPDQAELKQLFPFAAK